MAHFEKYKQTATGHMMAHYERDGASLERDNIDEKRSHLNYAVAIDESGDVTRFAPKALGNTVRKRLAESKAIYEQSQGRSMRSDAVPMGDWAITLPEDCPSERAEDFFRGVVDFAHERYGDAVIGGFVHMDETSPHMHMPVNALTPPDDEGKRTMRMSAIVTRQDLKTFHDDLQEYLVEHGIPGNVRKRAKDRPKFTNKLTQKELKEFDDYVEQVEQDGIALGRFESSSELSIAQERADALKKENEDLQKDLTSERARADMFKEDRDAGVRKYNAVVKKYNDLSAEFQLLASQPAQKTQGKKEKSDAMKAAEARMKASAEYIHDKARRAAEDDYEYGR